MRTAPGTPLQIWASPQRTPAILNLARLLYHFDNHFSGLRRIRNFSQESDARSMHAILGFQADVKAEAIDRGHRRLLCLNASKPNRIFRAAFSSSCGKT